MAREKYVGFSINFIFSRRCLGGGRDIDGVMSILSFSAVPFGSLEISGSAEPRTFDSCAPRSQPSRSSISASSSPFASSSSSTSASLASASFISTSLTSASWFVCTSATCSVFSLFSSPPSSSASGVLDRFVGGTSESGEMAGVGTEAENMDASTEDTAAAPERGVGAEAEVDDAPVPLVEAGIAIESGWAVAAGWGESSSSVFI